MTSLEFILVDLATSLLYEKPLPHYDLTEKCQGVIVFASCKGLRGLGRGFTVEGNVNQNKQSNVASVGETPSVA